MPGSPLTLLWCRSRGITIKIYGFDKVGMFPGGCRGVDCFPFPFVISTFGRPVHHRGRGCLLGAGSQGPVSWRELQLVRNVSKSFAWGGYGDSRFLPSLLCLPCSPAPFLSSVSFFLPLGSHLSLLPPRSALLLTPPFFFASPLRFLLSFCSLAPLFPPSSLVSVSSGVSVFVAPWSNLPCQAPRLRRVYGPTQPTQRLSRPPGSHAKACCVIPTGAAHSLPQALWFRPLNHLVCSRGLSTSHFPLLPAPVKAEGSTC